MNSVIEKTPDTKSDQPQQAAEQSPDREPKLVLHKLNWLEVVSIMLCLWLLFFPRPYEVIFAIVLALPFVGLILNGVSKPSLASLVSISEQDGKNKYDVADFIDFPAIAIMCRVLIDFEFESFYSILKVGTIGFALLLAVLFTTHKLIERANKNRTVIYLALVGNIALYSYAATYGVNCVYDNSQPELYASRVIDKSIHKGRRHTTYYLRVEPWRHHKDAENISVSKTQYDETEIGQEVVIDYKKGLLGIPWFYVE